VAENAAPASQGQLGARGTGCALPVPPEACAAAAQAVKVI